MVLKPRITKETQNSGSTAVVLSRNLHCNQSPRGLLCTNFEKHQLGHKINTGTPQLPHAIFTYSLENLARNFGDHSWVP